MLLASRHPIAETHPRLGVSGDYLSATPASVDTHYSVGLGFYNLSEVPRVIAEEAPWEAASLPRLQGGCRIAEIGADWVHIATVADFDPLDQSQDLASNGA